MTFDRIDLDPLEVSSDRRRREIIDLAESAVLSDTLIDSAIHQAIQHYDDRSLDATKQMMRAALNRDDEKRRLLKELNLTLANAGYEPSSRVACGNVAVRVNPRGPATILGRIEPPLPPDDGPEGDTDPDLGDRDELRDRMFEYGEMIKPQ